MPSASFTITNTLDEIRHVSDHTFATDQANLVGQFLGVTYGSVIRYQLDIPKDAVITSAFLRFNPQSTQSTGDCDSIFRYEDIDNATRIADDTDYHTRSFAATTVVWNNIPTWTTDVSTDGPSIATIIQAAVNRAGWEHGNFINILWEDNGSTNGHIRAADDWSTSVPDGSQVTTLEVSWTSSSEGVGSASGSATTSGVGESEAEADASSAGTSTASGVGESTAEGEANAAGVGAASGVGESTAETIANAAGIGVVTGISEAAGVASAAGSSVAAAVGQGIFVDVALDVSDVGLLQFMDVSDVGVNQFMSIADAGIVQFLDVSDAGVDDG